MTHREPTLSSPIHDDDTPPSDPNKSGSLDEVRDQPPTDGNDSSAD